MEHYSPRPMYPDQAVSAAHMEAGLLRSKGLELIPPQDAVDLYREGLS